MSVRLRRLKADYEMMGSLFGGGGRVRVVKTVGSPPEKYQIEYHVTSLQMDAKTQEVHTHTHFLAEITLTATYPRMAPQCRMLTPVFHPNIAPHAICIGDHWAAGESLAHLVVRIAEMLSLQSYNLKSPLNGEAARWVEQNPDCLPLETSDFSALLAVGEAAGRHADGTLRAGTECANCGKHGEAEEMSVCVNHHVACSDCMMECPTCHGTLCLKCSLFRCSICGRSVCSKCICKCASCGQLGCTDHAEACHVCGLMQCYNCVVACAQCGQATCVTHIAKVEIDGQRAYLCDSCRQAR